MTERLLSAYKRKITSFELTPAAGGCFELVLDGQLIYSKLATGSFPVEEEIVRDVGKRLLQEGQSDSRGP